MILAAGLGTRLKPWTDHHPKALAVVNGKSLLQRNIEYLQQFDIKDVVVNVHHFADQIIEAIGINKGWGSNVVISDETDEVLETGGGLMKASTHLKGSEPFLLMNVDILTDLDLNEMLHVHHNVSPLATLAISERETSRYFLFDEEDRLWGWRNVKTGQEKPANLSEQEVYKQVHQKAFSGIHIIDPGIFELIERQGKFSMVDAYLDLVQDRLIKGFDQSESKFIDVGKPESIEKAEKLFL